MQLSRCDDKERWWCSNDNNDDDNDGLILQSLCHEPAVISLIKQQYDIDVNVRSLKSFMVFKLTVVHFVNCSL